MDFDSIKYFFINHCLILIKINIFEHFRRHCLFNTITVIKLFAVNMKLSQNCINKFKHNQTNKNFVCSHTFHLFCPKFIIHLAILNIPHMCIKHPKSIVPVAVTVVVPIQNTAFVCSKIK